MTTKTYDFGFVATIHDADRIPTREEMRKYLERAVVVDLDFEGEGQAPEGCGEDAVTSIAVVFEDAPFSVEATYTSVWETGTGIPTPCKYDPTTKTVFNIEPSGVDVGDAQLTDEYVTLADGTELREEDGVTFDY